MTAAELTAIIGGVAAIFGAPGFVAYVNKRSKAPTVTAVANMYRDERDRLEKKIDAMSAEHAQKIADLEARYQSEIQRLREEIESLYRRMYQSPPHNAMHRRQSAEPG